ncbi:hypothetical protein EXE43_09575 [Halorubrum sp. SS5]|nr:hypothetical protein EXE43_09575 [Halorubrum sp. SS5]
MPNDDWIAVNDATGTELPSGSRATFRFKPDASGMEIDSVAASKYTGLTYEVKVDGDPRYGPAPVPPTDIDDMVTTHNPRISVERELEVIVRNPTNADRTVAAQIRGAER